MSGLVVARVNSESVVDAKRRVSGHAKDGEISEWAVPQRIQLVAEIPKTSVGKIDKKKLREQYG